MKITAPIKTTDSVNLTICGLYVRCYEVRSELLFKDNRRHKEVRFPRSCILCNYRVEKGVKILLDITSEQTKVKTLCKIKSVIKKHTMKNYRILPAIVFILSFLLISCGKEDRSIIIDNWEIHYGDGAINTIPREKEWYRITIPSTFQTIRNKKVRYYPLYSPAIFSTASINTKSPLNITSPSASGSLMPVPKEFSYQWLRGKFNIPDNASIYTGISLGRVYHRDEIYINNQLISTRIPDEYNSIFAVRNIAIPAGTMKKGENTIYIRLGIYSNWFGGILDTVKIQPEEKFKKTVFLYNLAYMYLPLCVTFLLFMNIVYALIFFKWMKKEVLFIWGFISALGCIIYILSIYSPYNPMSIDTCASIQLLFMPFIAITGLIFIQALHRIYFSLYNKIALPLLCILAIILLLNDSLLDNYKTYLIHVFIFFIIMLINQMILIYRLNLLRTEKYNSWLALLFTSIIGSVILFEYVAHFTGITTPRLLLLYTLPVGMIMLNIHVARDIGKRELQMAVLYEELKTVAEKNLFPDSEENKNGKADRQTITEISEEKLRRIIAFIEANFTADISREGLAAAVDMNPNYMSSMFKTFTGMKINQYINKLRIEDAAKKLTDKESKIIDVALSVGFESLTTFNRAFKEVMNTTPTEYRKNIQAN